MIWVFIFIVCIFLYTMLVRRSVVQAYQNRQTVLSSNVFTETHGHLRTLLSCLTDAFRKYNITDWWLDGGSLLGHVRHDGFIPHDDDIDICILIKDEQDITRLESCYAYIRETYPQFRLEKTISVADMQFSIPVSNRLLPLGVFIDLFYVRESDGLFRPNQMTSIMWPDAYYHKDKTYPLQQVEFEGSTVHIPSDPHTYLYQMYGDDCITVFKVTYIHCAETLLDAASVWWTSDIPLYVTNHSKK
jgi:hypothetical protein